MGIIVETFDKAKNKNVYCGVIRENVFYREVNSKHFMVKHGGYGIQQKVISGLASSGVEIIILTTNKGTVLESKLTDWIVNGQVADYGNGEQVFLNTDFMKSERR